MQGTEGVSWVGPIGAAACANMARQAARCRGGEPLVELISPRRRRALSRWWRVHRSWVVVFVVAVALGATGLAGGGSLHPLRGERFQSKQFTIRPVGEYGVRVREVVDVDFGRYDRHGLRREIPDDAGVPTDVRAESPTANDDLRSARSGDVLDVRIGNPFETTSGQHRYVLEYTYPDALRDTDSLALDLISSEDTLPVDRVEVVLTGFQFDATYCDVGGEFTHGGCAFATDGRTYRAELRDLGPGDGLAIAGDGLRRVDAIDVELPPLPVRPPGFPRLMGAVLGAAAILPIPLMRVFARWYGTNTVRRGGPAEAAFADGGAPLAPPPGAPHNDLPTYRVPDSRLDELATIEFAPPTGLRPWQGALAVNEAIDERSVTAWFSDMIASEALIVDSHGPGYLRLRRGPRLAEQTEREQRIIHRLFDGREVISFTGDDPRAVEAWYAVMDFQESFAATSGWWRRNPPEAAERTSSLRVNPYWVSLVAVHVFVIGLFLLREVFFSLLGVLLRLPFVALSPAWVAVPVVAVVAAWAYAEPARAGWPARSPAGSAAALRTLSFRRFLERSEGQHVQWAWEQGRLREYSGWAVALGASDAWGRTLDATDVEPGVAFVGAPPDLAGLGEALARFDGGPRRRRTPFDNPWPRYVRGVGKAMASGSSSGSGSRRSSSRRGSRGVGGGRGGGRSSTW